MKPITADNAEGRSLLALRAGPMTPGEVSARIGQSVPGWLLKAGLVTQDDSYYRITEAGRAACPHRNPLAAPGVVQPAIYIPETDMSRSNCITRQQVLAAIVEAGVAGTTSKALIERFDCADQVIYNHILSLTKQNPPAIFKPEKGRLVAIHFNGQVPPRKVVVTAAGKSMHATREAVLAFMEGKPSMTPATIADGIGCHEESTRAVLAGLYAGLKIDRAHDADLDDYRYSIGTPATVTQAATPAVTVAKEPAQVAVATPSSHPKQARVTNPKSPWRSAPATDSPRARPFKSAEAPVCTNSQTDFAIPSSQKIEALAEPTIPSSPAEKQEVAEPAAESPEVLGDLLMPEEAFETIEVKGIPDRRGPAVILVEHEEDFEVGIFSDSTMTLVWEDGINAATIEFCPEAVKKLRRFLGLFAEAV